jgi:hypothetical protein
MIKTQKIDQHFDDYLEQHKQEPIPLHEDYQKLFKMFS